MIKKVLTSAIFSFLLICLHAQERDESPVISPVVKKTSFADKIDYKLTAGTSFISAKGFGSGTSTYIAPELTYKFTPRFHLSAGVMILRSNLPFNRYQLLSNERSVVVKRGPSTRAIAYVSGDYLINSRLSVSGTLMKDLSSPSNFNKYGYNNSFQAMSLNMDYKLTDHITIGAGVHMTQGNNWDYPAYGLSPSNQFSPLLGY